MLLRGSQYIGQGAAVVPCIGRQLDGLDQGDILHRPPIGKKFVEAGRAVTRTRPEHYKAALTGRGYYHPRQQGAQPVGQPGPHRDRQRAFSYCVRVYRAQFYFHHAMSIIT